LRQAATSGDAKGAAVVFADVPPVHCLLAVNIAVRIPAAAF
jgi:hypothetical protein